MGAGCPFHEGSDLNSSNTRDCSTALLNQGRVLDNEAEYKSPERDVRSRSSKLG